MHVPSSFSLRFVRAVAGHPARLLILAWAIFFVAYYAGPMTYYQPIAPYTWVFIALCAASFAAAGSMTKGRRGLELTRKPQPIPAHPELDAVVQCASFLALAGCAA